MDRCVEQPDLCHRETEVLKYGGEHNLARDWSSLGVCQIYHVLLR